jgi:Zn-finger nucleic acid-binding protein
MLEHEDFKDIAAGIDIGDPEVGKKYNKIEDIKCPACPNSEMLNLMDPQQPHIWFESCPTCYGRFYDAGEFKDYADDTFSDFIKDLFAKERK